MLFDKLGLFILPFFFSFWKLLSAEFSFELLSPSSAHSSYCNTRIIIYSENNLLYYSDYQETSNGVIIIALEFQLIIITKKQFFISEIQSSLKLYWVINTDNII